MVRAPQAGPPGARIISTPQLQLAEDAGEGLQTQRQPGLLPGGSGITVALAGPDLKNALSILPFMFGR